nr:MAG TPA: hypothetical protein [Caudoviricetes sp.]
MQNDKNTPKKFAFPPKNFGGYGQAPARPGVSTSPRRRSDSVSALQPPFGGSLLLWESPLCRRRKDRQRCSAWRPRCNSGSRLGYAGRARSRLNPGHTPLVSLPPYPLFLGAPERRGCARQSPGNLRATSVRRCNSGGPHLQLYRHVIAGTPERRGRPGRNPRIIQLNRRQNL